MKQIYIDTLISVIISAFHSCHLAFETDLNGMHPRRENDAIGVLTFKAAVCVRCISLYTTSSMPIHKYEHGARSASSFARDARAKRVL